MNNKQSSDFSHETIKTEDELLFNEELCRICLQKGSIPIYDNDDDADKALQLSMFAAIDLSVSDPYPKYLCESCDSLLQNAILLRKRAQKTQRILKIPNKNVPSECTDPFLSDGTDQYPSNCTDQHPSECTVPYSSECTLPFSSECRIPIFASYAKKNQDTIQTNKNQLNYYNIEQETTTYIKNEIDIGSDQEQSNVAELFDMGFKESTDDELLEMDLEQPFDDDFDLFIKENDNSEEEQDFGLSFVTDDNEKKQGEKLFDPLYCRRCDMRFKSISDIREHRETDGHVNMKATCTVCNKVLKYTCLRPHMESHTSVTRYVCDVCGKHFRTKNVFESHHMTHTNYLPVKCKECPYRGRTKEALKSHMKRHTGEKRYQCQICPAKFNTNSNLHKHMRTHKTERDFKCQFYNCTKAFHTQRELGVHVKVVHAGIKDFKCGYCGKAFGHKKRLRKHEIQVHKRSKLVRGVVPLYLRTDYLKNQIRDIHKQETS